MPNINRKLATKYMNRNKKPKPTNSNNENNIKYNRFQFNNTFLTYLQSMCNSLVTFNFGLHFEYEIFSFFFFLSLVELTEHRTMNGVYDQAYLILSDLKFYGDEIFWQNFIY